MISNKLENGDYMKILFKNKTKYSKEIYDEYLTFHRKKYSFTYKLFTLFVIATILFCIILQIRYHYYSLAIAFCIVLTVFFLWRFLHPVYEVSKEYQSDKIVNEKEFTFIFYDTYFKIMGKQEVSNCQYWKLHKVFDADKFFYLYLDKNHALLLEKTGFLKGAPKDFSTFIKKKTLWKYRKIQ